MHARREIRQRIYFDFVAGIVAKFNPEAEYGETPAKAPGRLTC